MDELSLSLRKKYECIPCLKLAIAGDVGVFKKFIENVDGKSKAVNYVHEKSGDTPLLLAARHGHANLLAILLDLGGDIEHKNFNGKRALHEACFSGSLACIEILLKYGAKVDVLKHGDWTPLMIACARGHLRIVKKLVLAGADCMRINKDGWNGFHLAVRENHVDIADFLMSVQASVWKNTSQNGRTPLHTACMHNCLEATKFLMDAASYIPDEEDACGTTPFMDALRFGNIDIAQLLILKHNVNIQHTDKIGKHCLHVAAQSGEVRSIRYLLDQHYFDVHEPCMPNKMQAIHFAAKEGHIEALQILIEYGANINALECHNRTPLHLAAAANKIDMVKFIVLHFAGANIASVDVYGLSAADLARTTECKMLMQ